jgi:hypothetical protein
MQVLRYLVGLPTDIDECHNARAAAMITTPGGEAPTLQDALSILRYLVGIESPVLDEVYRLDR